MSLARTMFASAALLAASFALQARAQDSQNPSFNLLNRSSVAIRELYVTPAGDTRWGQNRLDAHPIPPGGSFAVRRRIDGNCIFDIRAVFADRRTEDRRDVNTCNLEDVAMGQPAGARTGAKAADDPSFRLVNRAAQPVEELFATPAGLGNWGQNRLTSGPIPAQGSRLVAIQKQPGGSCLFDLRVVFADHTARERHRTDLCRLTDLPVQ